MSKIRKARKLRTPNVPLETGPVIAMGGGAEPASPRAEAAPAFDYTIIKRDLTRIGLLAGSLIAILVVLSFFIR
jgi:hypothetical protein